MRKVLLSIIATLALATSIGYWSLSSEKQGFTVKQHWFEQSKYPLQEQSDTFKQQLLILTPQGASQNAAVFFILGNETDATKEALISLYKNYGSPTDIIFMVAEHRGYGQSVTDETQDIPDYVNAQNALTDYNNIITRIRSTYRGKWIIAGYSYGGALAIKYAHKYPESYDVALSSSGPIVWPQYFTEYGLQLEQNLGTDFATRLSSHFQNLSKQGDVNAPQDIELLTAVSVGLSQMVSMQYLTPVISGLSHLPTPSFTAVLNILMPASAYDWVNGQILSKAPFNASQRNWYTWKYQQCNELGTFFTGYPFSNSQQTYTERCNESFGFSPRPVNAQNWQLDRLIPEINKPLIIVAGGKDPWINVGIKPNHTFKNIKYLYSDDWFHCPDRDNTEAGLQAFSELRKALLTKTRI